MTHVVVKLVESTDFYAEIVEVKAFSTYEEAVAYVDEAYHSRMNIAKIESEEMSIEDVGEPWIEGADAFIGLGCASNMTRISWSYHKA